MKNKNEITNNISILILTLNEENNIVDCLKSVIWSDDIVVLDSFSKDNTISLSKKIGARIVKRKFDNWAAHQNWAMENIKFKHPWVFYLDADERMTDELKNELFSIANDPRKEQIAYFCGRRNYLWGKWLKHAFSPGFIMRFFKPPFVRFERLVNPTPVFRGPHGFLRSHLDHYHFSKGMTEWFEKHNRYSTLEAMEGIKLINVELNLGGLFSLDPYKRRQTLKGISFKLPFRAFFKFIYLFFFHLGILDGYSGFIYCMCQSIYEYMIVVKMRELKLKKIGLNP